MLVQLKTLIAKLTQWTVTMVHRLRGVLTRIWRHFKHSAASTAQAVAAKAQAVRQRLDTHHRRQVREDLLLELQDLLGDLEALPLAA